MKNGKFVEVGWTMLYKNGFDMISLPCLPTKTDAETIVERVKEGGKYNNEDFSVALVKITIEYANEEETRKYYEDLAVMEEWQRNNKK